MSFLGSFLTPQGVATAAFFMVVAMTIVGALIAVAARNIFHNVLGLVLALIGVAGLFLYLNSPFVALMEILIYVGAICIAICFAIMLSEPMYLPRRGPGLRLFVPFNQEDHLGPRGQKEHGLVGYHPGALPAYQLCPDL